jgi:hypothetical protein
MDINKIKKEFPNIKLKELNGSTGANLYLPGRLVITVFFKKRIFKTNEAKKFRRFSDDKDIVKIISALGNIKLKQSIGPGIPEPAPVQQPSGENTGVRACIDHIENKYQVFIKGNEMENKTAVMLKTIKQELFQYL